MQENKVLLFYLYKDIKQPELLQKAQIKLCEENNILGRIRIAKEGINGTVSGPFTSINLYKIETEKVLDSLIEWKEGQFYEQAFINLQVRLCDEIVTLKSNISFKDTAPRIEFNTFAELCQDQQNILIDVRNIYESKLGYFNNAICPDTRSFDEFPQWVKQNKHLFENKKNVLAYCTGGIRCERATAIIKKELNRGNDSVFHLKGGIVKYLESYKDKIPQNTWKGSCLMFDGRKSIPGNKDIDFNCDNCKNVIQDDIEILIQRGETDRCDYCRAKIILCNQCTLDDSNNSIKYIDNNLLCSKCQNSDLKKKHLLKDKCVQRQSKIQLSL